MTSLGVWVLVSIVLRIVSCINIRGFKDISISIKLFLVIRGVLKYGLHGIYNFVNCSILTFIINTYRVGGQSTYSHIRYRSFTVLNTFLASKFTWKPSLVCYIAVSHVSCILKFSNAFHIILVPFSSHMLEEWSSPCIIFSFVYLIGIQRCTLVWLCCGVGAFIKGATYIMVIQLGIVVDVEIPHLSFDCLVVECRGNDIIY